VLVVLTNAGIDRGWQWDLREYARKSESWYFSSLQGSQAPWIAPSTLEEQRALLPPAVYARLWLNQWQHSDGEFVSYEEAQACTDESLKQQEQGDSRIQYVAAIDYAEKRDLTVGVVCHHDGERVIVDRMDVVQPTPGRPTRVDWVEDWIAGVAARFVNTTFVVDEHQLVGTVQKLERKYDLRRFDFAGGIGNHRLALHLRQLIVHRRIGWYQGCGRLPTAHGPPVEGGERRVQSGEPMEARFAAHFKCAANLARELSSLRLHVSETGRLRIDHLRDGRHSDDRSFALGAACLHLAENPHRGPDLFYVTPPRGGRFAWG
jgi:hypothetical protein